MKMKVLIRKPPIILRYAVAVLSVTVALCIARWMQIQYKFEPFVIFLCAMIFSAWFGGVMPGLLALALSVLAFHFYFLASLYPLGMEKEIPRLLAAGLTSLFIVLLTALQRRTTESLKQANESLRTENTERKRTEEAMRESQQLLNLVLATLPVGVAVINQAGDIVLANEASKRIWGSTIISGRDRWAQSRGFWHASGKRIVPSDWPSVRALSKGQTSLNELIDIETFDGQKKIIQNSTAPIRNAEEKIVGAVIVNEDVTERVGAEEALKQAEDRIRLIIDTIPMMAWSVRPDGVVDFLNQRWLDYAGLSLEQSIKESTLTMHPEDIPKAIEKWSKAMASGEPYEEEMRLRRADGKYRWFLVRTAPLRDGHGNIIKWFGSSVDIEDRKQAEQMVRDSREQLRALTARLESSREEERIQIAREIHDDLGQKLTGLKMDLRRAERKIEGLESSPAVNSLLDTLVYATELTDSITTSIQEIAANLRPELLDKLGLSEALRYECRRFRERAGLLCEISLPEIESDISPEISTALFRIFQECLTNIARHAQAAKVKAALKLEDEWVVLRVEDNGRGITEDEIFNPKSLGLLGMKERTMLLGGEIAFRGDPKEGTIVTVRIPRRAVQKKESV